jgi:hypothetical protein
MYVKREYSAPSMTRATSLPAGDLEGVIEAMDTLVAVSTTVTYAAGLASPCGHHAPSSPDLVLRQR